MKITRFLAAAAIVCLGSAASAGPVQIVGGTEDTVPVLGNNFNGELTTAGATTLISGATNLNLSGAPEFRVTFSLVAAESGFDNTLTFDGSGIITETESLAGVGNFLTDTLNSASFSTTVLAGDLGARLGFTSTGPFGPFSFGDHEFGIFAASRNAKTFFLGLDDDGAGPDDNHDDIIVRVDVAAIPLPAAGWLLLAGLGGLYGLRRTRKTV